MDMTLNDIARVTRYTPASLRALARRGKIPGVYKLGGRWLVNREEFERLRNGIPDANTNKSIHSYPG